MKFEPKGHWFGLTPPADADIEAAWGARAILGGRGGEQYVDIVPDRRQCWTGDRETMPGGFRVFLSEAMLMWLDKGCDQEAGRGRRKRYIDPGSGETYRLDLGAFHAIASPNKSHGYLYIGAWMDTKVKHEQDRTTCL
jgi:hypothetical protein